jgi:GTP-binding protein
VYKADRGEHGLGSLKTGKSGGTVVVQVPVGTVIKDADSGEVVADLVHDLQEVVVAKGGKGGRGNAAYATSTNQAPRQYEIGQPGEERNLALELKLLADAGLVGLPNAGKSTLIASVSAARPKIADYPFTTLVPNLGIVRVREGESFVMADIPGLIAGAHEGRGLGHQFLRHIERTRVLVFLVEASSPDPAGDYAVLVEELGLFNPDLLQKPRIIALTKSDLLETRQRKEVQKIQFRRQLKRAKPVVPAVLISAVSRDGIPELLSAVWKMLSGTRRKH